MNVTYLKRAKSRPKAENTSVSETVSKMLDDINVGQEKAVREYARKLDSWDGEIIVSERDIAKAVEQVPKQLKDDIDFAHNNIKRFAEAQKATLTDFEVELLPGHWTGQKQIPIAAAGCYVPGGRYSHVASALMTVTTAKVAGVSHITAVSPPRPNEGIPASILYAMNLCGADRILNLGGVHAIAAMANGLFETPKADILVGPGNAFVAEAKRLLFGQVGIDMLAGPTDSLVIADYTADPELVAWDLVGQAEHGADSPVWLVTTDQALAEAVISRAPELIETLPEINAKAARASWSERAEVILCDTREEMAEVADQYAPEHLHVQAKDLDWWLGRLRSYGSLFLGEETTVPFGDKVSGPNHVLPTSGAARYTGGLSVHKFTKTVTWQRCDQSAMKKLANAAARISRVEGMEGHARSADARLEKSFLPQMK